MKEGKRKMVDKSKKPQTPLQKIKAIEEKSATAPDPVEPDVDATFEEDVPTDWDKFRERHSTKAAALVDNLTPDVTNERQKYGATMNGAECVELCNAVAYKNAASGWGVSRKDGGNHAARYDGMNCALDVLHHKPSNIHVDCLYASGEVSTPVWIVIGPQNDPSRPWVAPIPPKNSLPPEPPKPPVDPPKPPQPAYPGDNYWRIIGETLLADTKRARGADAMLDSGSGIWFGRVIWQHAVEGLTMEQAIKNQREGKDGWLRALGLTV